ncbi:unnamed protein product [Penicillium salamii]|uniref:Zn(2)-C6 fungal-type domain-containing protein n=1 Tax=Penicillium salamii TaxID=1612424 RepID=A0A9W4JXP1_9EURO|nr:unnamed protein product [Penicillium salamii]CAG8063539.1 unnamed protein product [Penicillium salamii]CAG8267426.1 unnamed protein product [Penicillium salamii]CAG8408574.1 unnamed protein product [Penicillium salamii]CAG8411462.1 unnamed protein product [Penicillium salamii]
MKHKSEAAIRKQKKSIACQRCHTHKIKCTGGQPCQRCRQSGISTECHYVNRDRQVKVHESYIEELAAENQRLRDQLSQSPGYITARGDPPSEDITEPADRHVQNPMIGKRAWFQPYDPSLPPIHICEAACTAFATRIRRVLTKSEATSHIARTQYTWESTLMSMRNPGIQWPSLPQARLLIQVVFSQVTRVYHVVLRRSTLDQLEDAYRKANFNDPVLTCKFFALFALGEVYSARSNSSIDCKVPGVAYYVNAIMLIPILPERPSLTHIESLLILSLYSFFLNRRHSAFLLVGSAMRLGLTLGLNHDIPEGKCPSPVDRQHRIRLWWAIYVFDRMYGSKAGWPIQIADEDIFVQMPSKVVEDVHDDHNSDTEFLVASIELAKITGQVIDQIYSRKSHADSFLQREQKLLIALKEWCFALPPPIRLHRDGPAPKNVVSLHLQFNQCIMLASRPVLLHALIQAKSSNPEDDLHATIRQTLKTLSEACIHSARNTHSLIMEEWINGSLPIFGYFYAHYLFSSALVMVVSSQVYSENANDFALFEAAFEILRAMSDHGNLAAAEFYDNLECVRQCLDPGIQPETGVSEPTGTVRMSNNSTEPLPVISSQQAGTVRNNSAPCNPDTTAGFSTNDMAFLGESMEEFLAQPGVDFDLADPSFTDGVDSWPNLSLWTG